MTGPQVTVKMIAMLDGYRRQRGLPTTVLLDVAEGGESAADIAGRLGLPLVMIDGVFLNHAGAGLAAVVQPGDRVAFVPRGTPASHPAFFGPFGARGDGAAAR
jgi:hypothetical protein